MSSKIAVLSTSQIQETFNTRGLPTPTATYELPQEDETHGITLMNFYSTGILEHCIENGFEVYVVTTREANQLNTHDQWWMDLVGGDRIFTTPTQDHAATLRMSEDERHLERSNRFFQPWRQLFQRVGIEFPECRYGFWTQLSGSLQKYNMTWGGSIKLPDNKP